LSILPPFIKADPGSADYSIAVPTHTGHITISIIIDTMLPL
jgi:hypothetical protein